MCFFPILFFCRKRDIFAGCCTVNGGYGLQRCNSTVTTSKQQMALALNERYGQVVQQWHANHLLCPHARSHTEKRSGALRNTGKNNVENNSNVFLFILQLLLQYVPAVACGCLDVGCTDSTVVDPRERQTGTKTNNRQKQTDKQTHTYTLYVNSRNFWVEC